MQSPKFDTIEVENTTLSYVYSTPSEGRPKALIVCIHGTGYDSAYFTLNNENKASIFEVAPLFGFAVCAIDRPGYGRAHSQILNFDEQAPILSQAAVKIRDRLAPDSAGVFLAGHSMGGMIATLMAANHPPANLLGVEISGISGEFREGAVETLKSVLDAKPQPSLPEPEARRARMFGPDGTFCATILDRDISTAPLSRPHELEDGVAWEGRFLDLAPKIRVPVSFVFSEHDGLFCTDQQGQSKTIQTFSSAPFVESRVQRGAGHCPHLHHVGRAFVLRSIGFFDEVLQAP